MSSSNADAAVVCLTESDPEYVINPDSGEQTPLPYANGIVLFQRTPNGSWVMEDLRAAVGWPSDEGGNSQMPIYSFSCSYDDANGELHLFVSWVHGVTTLEHAWRDAYGTWQAFSPIPTDAIPNSVVVSSASAILNPSLRSIWKPPSGL